MESWKNIIPLGLVLPFLIIIFLEVIIFYGLGFYSQRLNQQITNLDSLIKQKQESLAGALENDEAFRAFSQMVNLVEVLNQKHSLSFVINKFNGLMPRFVTIKDFSYDAEQKTISISASIYGWVNYVRFYEYISNLKDYLEVKSVSSPSLDERGLVNFSVVFSLKPNFFQQ